MRRFVELILAILAEPSARGAWGRQLFARIHRMADVCPPYRNSRLQSRIHRLSVNGRSSRALLVTNLWSAGAVHCQFFINGTLVSEFRDRAPSERFDRGTIALQIHDAGTQVEFADSRLRKLDRIGGAKVPK